MGIEWQVAIDDKVSGPATAAGEAMGRAAQKAGVLTSSLDRARDAITRAEALGNIAGFQKATRDVAQLEAALSLLPPPIKHVEEETLGMAGAWEVFKGSLAAHVVEEAFGAIVDKGKELIATAIQATERVEHLTEVFQALSGAGEGAQMGKAIFAMTRDLAKQLPQSEAQVQSWTRSLMGAGVTDMGKLQGSLKAIAGAESLVEGGGDKVRGMLAKLNEASMKGTKFKFSIGALAGTGLTEEDVMRQLGMTPRMFELAKKQGTLTGTSVADAMVRALGEKAAGPLAGQMGELGTITTKAKDAFMRLLEGVNTKPLVEGLSKFFSLFDEANPSGKLMKDLIGGAFNYVFTVAGKVFSFLEDVFLHIMIWSVETNTLMKKHAPTFEALGAVIGGIMVTALGAMAIAAVPAIAAAWSLAAGVIAATWPILAIGAAIGLVAFGIYEMVSHWPEVKKFFGDLADGAWNAAKNFVTGLVDGIRNGVGLVVEAVQHMGTSAWNALKGALGIHSPSALTFDVGMNVSKGMAGGIEAGTPQVEQSAATMGAAAVPRVDSAGSGSRSVSVTFGDIVIHAGHAGSPEQLRGVVEEEMASWANRISNMMGSAPVPA